MPRDMSREFAFKWEGKEISDLQSLEEAMLEVYTSQDKERGQRFMDAYRVINPNADSNIGYMTGYYGDIEGMCKFFDVYHPFFGRTTPTLEEALQMGMKWGESHKHG